MIEGSRSTDSEAKVRSLFSVSVPKHGSELYKARYIRPRKRQYFVKTAQLPQIAAKNRKGPPRGDRDSGPDICHCLVALLLASDGFLDAFLFARLQIEGMQLNFPDNVLLLNLALEAPQGIFEGLALLNPNFRQNEYTT